jgi:ABC-type glycerol-3-phosphate transport system permease component
LRLRPRAPVLHVAIAAMALLTLLPLLWMVRTAFTPHAEVFRSTLALVPANPTLANFPAAFGLFPVGDWFVNSLLIATACALGKLVVAAPAAFAFARGRFPGRDAAFALAVGTMTVPYVITLIPTYMAVVRAGLYDTHLAVIVPTVAHCGFACFFLRQAFRQLPAEIFEAASIDGAGPWRQFLLVALPNVRAALAALFVLGFLSAWNLYLWPLLVLESPENKTLSIGLKLFATTGEQGGQWGPLMATAMLGAAPVLMLFLLAQKQIVSAFVTSGIR